jgi:hypothetical protein
MRVARSLKLVGIAWLACGAWLGCNAILGNESAEFDPDAAARLDGASSDGITNADGTTTTDGASGDASADVDVDVDGGPCPGIDLDGSSTNCGACGHSCRGGACVSGRCQPVVLATDLEGPHALVLRDGFVYWVNNKTGDVQRVAVDGGTKQLVFDGPDDTSGDSIAFSGSNLYYPLAILDGGVMVCPQSGCSATPPYAVANLDVPHSVFIAGSELYFVESGINARVGHCTLPCNGGFTAVTPPEGLPSHIAAEGSGVYWSAVLPSPGLRGKEGTDNARTVASTAPVGEIAVFPGEVYWTERGFGPRVAPRDGGAIKNLRIPAAGSGTGTQSDNLFVTSTSIYFTESSRGTIWQCPRTGCPDGGGAPVFTGPGAPYGIAADDGSIYWADEGSPDGGGFIYRLAK